MNGCILKKAKSKSRIVVYLERLGQKTKKEAVQEHDLRIEAFLFAYNEKKKVELEEKRVELEEKKLNALLLDLEIRYRQTLISNLLQVTHLSHTCDRIDVSENLISECMKTVELNEYLHEKTIESLRSFSAEITRDDLFFRDYKTNRFFCEQMHQFLVLFSQFSIKDNLLFHYLGPAYNDIFLGRIMSVYYKELVFMNGTVLNFDTMYLLLSSIRGGWSLAK